MSVEEQLIELNNYFRCTLEKHGATPKGVDYNSEESQHIRFAQLLKLTPNNVPFTVIDYGCGYGALYDYIVNQGYSCEYFGYDLIDDMVRHAMMLHDGNSMFHCTSQITELPVVDYVLAGAIFNIKLDAKESDWTDYVLKTLSSMNSYCRNGFAFNMLTKYSDKDRMRPDLYYGDPCYYFDYCKNKFSKDVALLHDYGLYDFTILVRKN
jgi:SAM-dependent methyltransferase